MVLHNLDVRNKLAEKTGLYKKDVNLVLDAFRELVYEEMEAVSYTHLTLPTNSRV